MAILADCSGLDYRMCDTGRAPIGLIHASRYASLDGQVIVPEPVDEQNRIRTAVNE